MAFPINLRKEMRLTRLSKCNYFRENLLLYQLVITSSSALYDEKIKSLLRFQSAAVPSINLVSAHSASTSFIKF